MELVAGLMDALSFLNLLYVFLGVGLGIIVGGIPGLSGPIAIAMTVPLTYFMPTVGAIGFLVGINKGACFGGSISAVLINTPGAAEAAATTFDGYPLAQKGRSMLALKIALCSSVFGDVFSTALLILVAGAIAQFALKLGPVEQTSILLLALTLIAALESESFLKGVIAACFGLLLSCVGTEPVTYMPRLTFGMYQLENGINIAALCLGLLAMAEIVRQSIVEEKKTDGDAECIDLGDKENNRLTLTHIKTIFPTWIKSSIFGSLIGICPGLGSSVAAFLAYGIAKKAAKPGEHFGEGEVKGIAAPEAANNAVVGSSLIPLFTLGIPGSVAASLMIGAFVIHGITPGPLMFEEHARSVYGIYGSMIVACVAVLVLGVFAAKTFCKFLEIPRQFLYSAILFTCILGAFVLNSLDFDVYLAAVFTFVGFFLKMTKFSFVAVIIGFVLGEMLELALQQTMIASHMNIFVLFERPISCFFMCIGIAFIIYFMYDAYRKKKAA